MPTPTVRVFVSSTWLDLKPERVAIRDAVLRMKELQFSGMEYFGSRHQTTEQASLDDVDDCHLYVGIFAARYGSGITEKEYRRAREHGLPCLIYFKDDSTISDADDFRETDPAQVEKLGALRRELRANHLIGPTFVNPQDLAAKVATDLHNWLFEEYLKPTLERAARGEVPDAQADALMSGVKDASALGPSLRLLLTARHQLRAPVGDFVGREKEADALTDALRNGDPAGISGMGGVGKTELALHVANRLRDAYPDAQLFVDMRGTGERPRDPADALAACIRAFAGPEQRLPESREELTALYRDALTAKRALVLLDNACDAAQVRPLLPPAGSALLVTSREAIPLPGMKTRVTLEQLQPAEARALVTGIAPRVPADIADQVCYLCGYLPLAIRAAGSLLDITADLDPAAYAEQLRDGRTRLALIGMEGVDLDVEASLGLSYQRLSPDAARVFRQLSAFPESFDATAEESICEDPGHKHLSALVRRGLVLYNTSAARYRLHDLSRLFAAARMGEEELSAGRMRHAAHYLSVLWETNRLYKQGGEDIRRGLSLFDSEWRNIQAGQSWAEKHSGENDEAALLCSDYPNAGVYALDLRRHPSERILWMEAALAAARRLEDRPTEGAHLINLGYFYSGLGETRRAIELYEQGLSIIREIGERHNEGVALNLLGVAYTVLGETRRAIEFYEQRLVIAREVGDRRGEGHARGNLGTAYSNLGETRRAIEFYEQALVIIRDIGDRRGEGVLLSSLGSAYAALGETGRAVEFHEQSLAINREIGDRRAEGQNLGNLGKAYATLGETRRAIEFYEQDLVITREVGDRLGEGAVLFNTSLVLNEQADRAGAITHAEAALEIFEQLESPHAANVRAQIAQWRGQE